MEKSTSGRRNSMYKGPAVGDSVVLGNRRQAVAAWAAKEGKLGLRKTISRQSRQDLGGVIVPIPENSEEPLMGFKEGA